MENVVDFPGITRLDILVSRVITKALEKDLNEVVIIGYDKDGDFYFSSSKSDGGSILWLLELAKTKLIKIGSNE